MRLRQIFSKQPLSAMHLLALSGTYGIGRLGYALPGQARPAPPPVLSRQTLLETAFTPALFDALVHAYLSTGAGIAGMQPKIMVPDRPTVPIPIPTLIVKAGSPARKYHGSYERMAEVLRLLRLLRLAEAGLHRFFEPVAFTVMVRNGDGHLKNYGVLDRSAQDIWLAPMFDVVTTSIYRYQRYDGGPELEGSTLALKLFAGKGQTRGYPGTAELLRFGRTVCRVAQPAPVLQRIGEAMQQTLNDAGGDARVPVSTLAAMRDAWSTGLSYAREAERHAR